MAGLTHAREMPYVKGGALAAVCSRDAAKVQQFATEFNVPRCYTDYRQLVEDPAVDVVCVLSPTGMHADVAVAASNAGKHLLIEKPLEANLEQADLILDTCRKNKTKLGVIFQMRFGSVCRTLRDVVSSGALGRVYLADAFDKSSRTVAYYNSAAWRGTKKLEGGGCLMTQSIHIVDLLVYLMGPVKSVVAKVNTQFHDIEVEDTATALVTFESGCMGVIESTSSIRPAMKSRLELHGERGTIVANAQYDKIMLWNVDGVPPPTDMERDSDLGDIDDPWAYPQVRHRIQLQDMVDAIHEDREPILTGEEARIPLALVMAIYESSRTGKEISMQEYPYCLAKSQVVPMAT
jgi:predicted dehydrogenase